MKNSTNENDYRGFSNESYKYILNLSVLPFVFANKNYFKVKYHKKDKFKFYYNCENGTKVLIVDKNKIKQVNIVEGQTVVRCLTNVDYLKEKEGITNNEALQVILGTYNGGYYVADKNLRLMVKKYQESLKSDEFFEFIKEGCNRAKIDEVVDSDVVDYYKGLFDLYLRATKKEDDPGCSSIVEAKRRALFWR